LAAQRIGRRKRDGMHQAVHTIPTFRRLFDRARNIRCLGDVHLENFGHRVELFGRHLRDAHHPAEAGEKDLCALALRLLGNRKTDAPPV
jgi:hypothetical protein